MGIYSSGLIAMHEERTKKKRFFHSIPDFLEKHDGHIFGEWLLFEIPVCKMHGAKGDIIIEFIKHFSKEDVIAAGVDENGNRTLSYGNWLTVNFNIMSSGNYAYYIDSPLADSESV